MELIELFEVLEMAERTLLMEERRFSEDMLGACADVGGLCCTSGGGLQWAGWAEVNAVRLYRN